MTSGGDAELLADVQQALADPALDLDAVVHQLQEVPVLAEDLLVLGGGPQRLLLLAQPQPGLHLAGGAAGGGDQPSDHCEIDSLSIRGHFWSQPSEYASEESRKRLCRPVELAAQIVLWV